MGTGEMPPRRGSSTQGGTIQLPDDDRQGLDRGLHQSSLSEEAIEYFWREVKEKVAAGQAKVILWEDIKHNPPPQLKVSPVVALPYKLKAFRTILDLSF